MDKSITIDLVSKRVVYESDLKIGLRQIDFEKGVNYVVAVTFVSGDAVVTPTISGFSCVLAEPNKKTTPLLATSGFEDGAFVFRCASPTLDYAIHGNDFLLADTDIEFYGDGVSYNLVSVPTKIVNNSSLSAPQQYYPLNDNPADYATQDFVEATYVPQSVSGQFSPSGHNHDSLYYPLTANPSGYVPVSAVTALQAQVTALQAFIDENDFLLIE